MWISFRGAGHADETELSVGQVAKVKNLLINHEWLSEDDGMALSEPEKLLSKKWPPV
jgi:hypothetical protein